MFWISRPAEDAERLAAELQAGGVDIVCAPLMERVFEKVAFDEGSLAQGLIATSRGGLRGAVQSGLPSAYYQKPLFVIGAASANFAKSLGFKDIRLPTDGRGAADLVPLIVSSLSPDQPLLHLRGDQAAFDLKGALEARGYALREVYTYRMAEHSGLDRDIIKRLSGGEIKGIILMSARTARVYRTLMQNAGLTDLMSSLCHVCLSTAVAEALGVGADLRVEIAEKPCQTAIVDLVKSLSV